MRIRAIIQGQNRSLSDILSAVAIALFVVGISSASRELHAQQPLSHRIAAGALERWPDGHTDAAAKDGFPVLLDGMSATWYDTADGRYFRYVKSAVDAALASGSSDAALGRQLLLLYRVTQNKHYYDAVSHLYQQHPPASFTDAQDAPFYAEYAAVFQSPQDFTAITRQLTLSLHRAHGASQTCSAMMAAVDALPYYPEGNAGRSELIRTLQHIASSTKPANDASSSLICSYALAKAARLGYLPKSAYDKAEQNWKAVQPHLTGADTSFGPKETGLALLASGEMEMESDAKAGLGNAVLVDAWFNSQTRKNAAGQTELFHYKWDDVSNSGYSLFGHIFRCHGIATGTLAAAPTLAGLNGAQFYVIVSPDNPSKNPNPHYMTAEDADQIAAWVEQGGTLLLMENDPDNADIVHLDLLADKFGLHFNNALTHHVIGNQHEMGRMDLSTVSPPFTSPHVLFMKDTSSLALSKGATPLLTFKGDVLMGSAKYGKGMVFAVADPWTYNEYTDGRNLPPEYDNFAAGNEVVRWLLEQRSPSAH